MSTYEGPATLRQGDTAASVQCGFTIYPPSQQQGRWIGRFTEADVRLEATEAELTLPDGATGLVLIDRINGTGRSGTFMGAGPPPGPRNASAG